MANAAPLLSVVMPVLNGAHFLPTSLPALTTALDRLQQSWEIVAVDDGSRDGTAEILKRWAVARPEQCRVVTLPTNAGKFAALRAGMEVARGACRIFIDADLPFELNALAAFQEAIVSGTFDIVIGDRTLAESRSLTLGTPVRRIAHVLFSQLVRAVSLGGFADSQCGMKGYRGEVAAALFPLLMENRFAGDVEHLYIALKHGLSVGKLPVVQLEHGSSTVGVLAAALDILRTMILLPFRWWLGRYRSASLARLGEARQQEVRVPQAT